MNRYKFRKADFPKAVEYIKTGKGDAPNWAKRDGLTVKGSKIYYGALEILAHEDVDAYLRKKIYAKEADTPAGRDSAYHIIKSQVLGCPRRRVMEWLRAQKSLGETRSATAQPKRKAGVKLGRPTFEVDLCFIRKADLIDSGGARFDKRRIKDEQYICTCVEKTSGLCKLDLVQTKEPSVVTPIVIKQIKALCKRLKLDPAHCSARMDMGTEFSVPEIKKLVPDTKAEKKAQPGVEKKNQQLQQAFYRLLKNRQAITVRDAVRKSETLCNQTVSKFHKITPNEIADDEKTDMKQVLKKYNSTRKSYIKGDKRKPFVAGDHVRVLVKDQKAGIGFKSYKNESWTERVFVIKKVTKKAVPPKFYVNGRWHTQDTLLKSAPRDQKSIALIAKRDQDQKEEDARVRVEEDKKREAQFAKDEARKNKLRDEDKITRVRSANARKVREKIAARKRKDEEAGRQIEAAEEAFQKKRKGRKKPKRRKRYFSQPDKDEEWVPGMD
jgi:hypothetical protein